MGCFPSVPITSVPRCTNLNANLIEVDYKETKPFIVPLTSGYVIKVYDGDTITICNRLPISGCDDIFRFSVRLANIDTPEIKGKTPEEKKAAIIARDALKDKIYNKHVRLENVATEKYGRILATIYLGDENINVWMVKNRYAVPYDGGKKELFTIQ